VLAAKTAVMPLPVPTAAISSGATPAGRARAEEALRAMDEIATIGDEEERTATLDMLLKFLDEEPL